MLKYRLYSSTDPNSFIGNFPTQRIFKWAILVVLANLFCTVATEACILCIRNPKPTIADSLAESKTVVLAKERRLIDSEKKDNKHTFFSLFTGRPINTDGGPYFHIVKVLKGATDQIEINAFVDYKYLRYLSLFPEDTVVFRQKDTDSNWKFIAYADLDFQEFIRGILRESPKWVDSRTYKNRIDFFFEYLNHNNKEIKEQAHLEVARAPYASIKRISGSMPRKQIREILATQKRMKWHSLYILMLGQSQHTDDHTYIREQLESAAANGLIQNLSAWVTAFIETHPNTGVEMIENLYFTNRNRAQEELEEVCRSLSVLGSEVSFPVTTEFFTLRRRIIQSYITLLKNYPQMVGPVVKDLTGWQIRALIKQLTQIGENKTDLDSETQMALSYYLSISKQFLSIDIEK